MPEEEGLALYEAALTGGKSGPLLEIGSYCGKSTIYLGAAARERNTVVYTIDHHRGSEEHQVGEEFHDPRLVDPATGAIDTFPEFRRTIAVAGLEDVVVPIVADSVVAARGWSSSLGMLFVDGGHSEAAARADYKSWAPLVVEDGLLAIHDVFEDPAEGGRPPFEIYELAVGSGFFDEIGRTGSLRVLQRVSEPRR